MPTSEEVEKFKRAFKKKAKAANKRIRWEEPTGCFSFMKAQSSLSGILEMLENLQGEPTLENIRLVEDEIDNLHKDTAKKYKEAIDELKLSLKSAAIEEIDVVESSSDPEEDSSVIEEDSSVIEEDSSVIEEEWTAPSFDFGVLPSTSVVEAFVGSLGHLPKWKQEREKEALVPIEDDQTKMIFCKDALDTYSKEPKYIIGKVPTTQSDSSCVGQKLKDFSQNEQALVGVGLEVISDIRSKLTKGPFNNYLGLPKKVTDEHLIPKELLAEKLHNECGEMSLSELKEHAMQMFKVEGLEIDEVSDEIEQLDEAIKKEVKDSKRYKSLIAQRNKLADQLMKLQKIDELAELDDLGEWLKEVPAPGWWNSVVDTAAGIAAGLARKKYKDVADKKIQMACLGRATLEVGGGVCSKMAMATHGALMTKLPPGSEIAQVFHNFDHEFVAARVPGGRWFVVDPWPHDPMVVPFVDSYFDPKDVENFVITVVKETCEHPYGIDLDTGFNWSKIIKQAKAETNLGSVEMKGTYGHTEGCVKDVDPKLKGTSAWG